MLVSSFFQASTATLWTSWLGSVVPESRRGRYFGFRTGVVGVVGMLANLGAGWFLDRVDAPLNFQVVLGVGVVAAVLGAFLLLFHYEPPTTHERPNFRKLLVFGVYWQASVLIAAPFIFSYFLTELTMSFTQIAVWSIIASLSALFTTSWWGRVADRYGNKQGGAGYRHDGSGQPDAAQLDSRHSGASLTGLVQRLFRRAGVGRYRSGDLQPGPGERAQRKPRRLYRRVQPDNRRRRVCRGRTLRAAAGTF